MVISDIVAGPRETPRTLAGASVLQIVPSLGQSVIARKAVNVAHALVQAGGRAIVAGEDGALVGELKAFGGEWLCYSDTTFNPIKLRRNVELLAKFLTSEQVDIVHARSAGAAWSALPVTERLDVRLVTELSDIPYAHMLLGAHYLRALSSGDRVMTHSYFDARPMIERYGISPQRVSVIPRIIDINLFDPSRVNAARVGELRQSWGVPSGARVVLVPGHVAPGNGQIMLVEAVRILAETGMRGVTFVLAGDDRRHPRHVRSLLQRAQEAGVAALFRLVGRCPDLAAAFAAADFVVVPYSKPPVTGRTVAEAQAMARPVIATSVGALPENMLAPPRVPEDLRTGWVVPPDDPSELAGAFGAALALDEEAYRALGARARKFAAFMFTPESIVAATLEVYNSLLQAKT